MTNLEILCSEEFKRDPETIHDILLLIDYKRQWKLTNLEAIAEKIEYSYGGGLSGLVKALYNLLLA